MIAGVARIRAQQRNRARWPRYSSFIRTVDEAIEVVKHAVIYNNVTTVRAALDANDAQLDGAIYVIDDRVIHRWTDGRNWSNTRQVGSFMVYREVIGRNQQQRLRPGDGQTIAIRQELVPYVGSLQSNTFRFRDPGLAKRTILFECKTGRVTRSYRIMQYFMFREYPRTNENHVNVMWPVNLSFDNSGRIQANMMSVSIAQKQKTPREGRRNENRGNAPPRRGRANPAANRVARRRQPRHRNRGLNRGLYGREQRRAPDELILAAQHNVAAPHFPRQQVDQNLVAQGINHLALPGALNNDGIQAEHDDDEVVGDEENLNDGDDAQLNLFHAF